LTERNRKNANGKMSRKFVMGDIHGAYRALVQCLSRSKFDYENDQLIFLGDVADGWPDTRLCVEELLKIKNLVYVFGNHDFWTLEWMQTGAAEAIWLEQGGRATVKSYGPNIPASHIKLLNESLTYYVEDNKLFVHAGFDPRTPLVDQGLDTFLWDRNLALVALEFHTKGIEGKLTTYDEVFLGHTPVDYPKPLKACEIWLMDTGAGWSGPLSMMDLDTYESYTSDPVPSLYPGIEGRKKFR
jgi:serine/threonine protein phosphatase 1